MADKISATLTYLDATNNKGTKAITDISPTADNGAIKNFCVGLLGLTTNTLSQIDRVEKTDITNAVAKPKLTLTLANDAKSALMFSRSSDGSYLFSGTLPAFTYKFEAADTTILDSYFVNFFQSNDRIRFGAHTTISSTTTETVTATVYFAETDTTAATTAQIVISYDAQPVLTIL